jgi:Fe-S cluster biosynthesis and repair protein YggX
MPRVEMARMLVELGEPAPVSQRAAARPEPAAGPGGFRCQRPTCMAGAYARQLPAPPFGDELGRRIHEAICADCWNEWLRNYSIKVINELRLDLSTEYGQAEYDRYMREFLGLE